MSDSTGTHVAVRMKDGRIAAYLLNDLPAPLKVGAPASTTTIEQIGQSSISILANASSSATVITIPALTDSVLANYRIFAMVDFGTASYTVFIQIGLLTTTTFRLFAVRPPSSIAATAATSPTDNASTPAYPSDTQVDPGTGHTHATNSAGLTQHTHTITGTHTHALVYPGAITFNVDWMIVHK